MRTVEAGLIGDAVRRLFIGANIDLPDGVRRALERARELETWAPAIGVLKTLEENSNTAQRLGIPICQDTGMACVFLDIGSEVFVDGDIAAAVDDGVARACREGYLRASVVSDPLRRENTGDNTPA
ncbi:MAG: fumarate hydratase, partial [Clostridiales bacterium]|nr:fumarate hydratase [Clostridiales bacterium]